MQAKAVPEHAEHNGPQYSQYGLGTVALARIVSIFVSLQNRHVPVVGTNFTPALQEVQFVLVPVHVAQFDAHGEHFSIPPASVQL